jgi:hypothetical protein
MESYYMALILYAGFMVHFCFSESVYTGINADGETFPISSFQTDYVKVKEALRLELESNANINKEPAANTPTKVSIELLTRYFEQLYTPSEISIHVPYLYAIAQQSSSILELGTGKDFRASWGFLRGLAENDKVVSGKKLMVGVDLMDIPETEMIQRIAKEHDIEYHFHQANDLELPIKEMYGMFDVTFIDTWHCYGQLHRELKLFPAMTRKFLIFHDVNMTVCMERIFEQVLIYQ